MNWEGEYERERLNLVTLLGPDEGADLDERVTHLAMITRMDRREIMRQLRFAVSAGYSLIESHHLLARGWRYP